MIIQRHRYLHIVAMLALIAPFVVDTSVAVGQGGAQVLFGAHAAVRNEATEADAFAGLETRAGRIFGAARTYSQWDESFPDRYETWLSDGGRTLVYSVKTKRSDGTDIAWASIAAARPGSRLHNDMKKLGDQFKAFGKPMYVILHHEPEAEVNRRYGTSADFVGAWRNFVSVIRGQGASNVKFLLTLVDYSYVVPSTDRRAAAKWYPGDDVVDAIGADAYNWYRCRGRDEGWKSLQQILEPFRQFGAAHPSKELWLPEFASAEDPADPSRKGAWFAEAANLFTQAGWGQFRGVLYFHDEDPNNPGCAWWLDSSPQSIAGFAKAGDAVVFGGNAGIPPCPGGLISCGARASAVAVRGR